MKDEGDEAAEAYLRDMEMCMGSVYAPDGVWADMRWLIAQLRKSRAALRPFAAMDRDGCDPTEHACVRGIASDMTVITSGDFCRARQALLIHEAFLP